MDPRRKQSLQAEQVAKRKRVKIITRNQVESPIFLQREDERHEEDKAESGEHEQRSEEVDQTNHVIINYLLLYNNNCNYKHKPWRRPTTAICSIF